MPAAPTFLSDTLGNANDSVVLTVNGQRIAISTGWEVVESVLSQPSTFTLRLGRGDLAKSLLSEFPPNSGFQLMVGGAVQFVGRTDAIAVDQTEGQASYVEISGRDALAPLHDAYVTAQVSVNVGTYAELVWYALGQVGLVPASETSINPNVLATDNVANLQIKTGVPVTQIAPHQTVQQILDNFGLSGANVGTVLTTPTARIGETWLRFIRRHIDRAGLMLWATAGGTFVLAAPNGTQAPTYQLHRMTGDPKDGGNVVAMAFKNDLAHRHSEVVVYGRGGGRVLGRTKARALFDDQEMQLVYGVTGRPMVVRDTHCHSNAEAAFFARRKIAEERRSGFRLEYTVAGHTLPYLPSGGGTTTRAVIVPDTVVSVRDDELGIQDNFYIETVIRRRSPQTTTTIRLMRLEDLLFASDEDEESA